MAITYKFIIKTLNTTKTEQHDDVVSHIHFDYVGTDENGKSAFCQCTIPFQIHEYRFDNPATGVEQTIPSVLNADSFTHYNDITEEMVLSWINEHLPTDLLQSYQNIIINKLQDTHELKSNLPWKSE